LNVLIKTAAVHPVYDFSCGSGMTLSSGYAAKLDEASHAVL